MTGPVTDKCIFHECGIVCSPGRGWLRLVRCITCGKNQAVQSRHELRCHADEQPPAPEAA